jgi:DNA-3-methyladenine glycosylase
MITEVEAYDGQEDEACHARHGKTERNAPMFNAAGCWYVYMIYGMYYMLNIVT